MEEKKVKSPEERSVIALKAVETRRKRDPKWGTRKKFKTVCWQDSQQLHERLAVYCSAHDVTIGSVYAEIVQKYLDTKVES